MDYLPRNATIEQACAWLHAKTGETWILPRLLECGLLPHFWLAYKPGFPLIFGHRTEGFQTRMIFAGDLQRLEADGTALVTMFVSHDDKICKAEPGWPVPLSELRFKRADVEEVEAVFAQRKKPQPARAAPVAESAASEPVEQRVSQKAGAQFSMPKAVMISAHEHEWPTIRADMNSAAENGLHVAKAGARGWIEQTAMDWAKAKGRLASAQKPIHSLTQGINSMANIKGTRHTPEG